MIRRLEPGAQRPPMRVLLAGALLPIGVVGVVATVIGAVQSRPVMAGALIGTALAALAFSVGPLIMGWAQNWSPPAVMAVAMTAYMVLTGALAVIYLLLLDRSGISLPAIGWTLFACAAASIAGIVRASSRVRVLAFGSIPAAAQVAPPDAETAGQPGNRPAPHTRGD